MLGVQRGLSLSRTAEQYRKSEYSGTAGQLIRLNSNWSVLRASRGTRLPDAEVQTAASVQSTGVPFES